MSHAQGSPFSTPSVSFPVNTARTPGWLAAALVSTDLMAAWAYTLRRMAACAMPGSQMSSV